MAKHRIFKYFSERRWADAFLDGSVHFHSLAYFRDYEEDEAVRGDDCEGVNVHAPIGGLHLNNLTRGTQSVHDAAFVSTVKQGEIFVFCASRMLSAFLAKKFGAVACVEVREVSRFLVRVQHALPANAKFRAGRVRYYKPTDDPNPTWALPDDIAMAKLKTLDWQHEFRIIFSTTDALDFEKASYQIVFGKRSPIRDVSQHHELTIKTKSLQDICTLHDFAGASLDRRAAKSVGA